MECNYAERMALTLNTLNIMNAHLSQLCEVPQPKAQLQNYLALGNTHPQLSFRIGPAEPMPRSHVN